MPEGIKLSNQLYPATAAQILSQAEYIHDSNWNNELWSNNTEIGPLNGNRKDQLSINAKLLSKANGLSTDISDILSSILDIYTKIGTCVNTQSADDLCTQIANIQLLLGDSSSEGSLVDRLEELERELPKCAHLDEDLRLQGINKLKGEEYPVTSIYFYDNMTNFRAILGRLTYNLNDIDQYDKYVNKIYVYFPKDSIIGKTRSGIEKYNFNIVNGLNDTNLGMDIGDLALLVDRVANPDKYVNTTYNFDINTSHGDGYINENDVIKWLDTYIGSDSILWSEFYTVDDECTKYIYEISLNPTVIQSQEELYFSSELDQIQNLLNVYTVNRHKLIPGKIYTNLSNLRLYRCTNAESESGLLEPLTLEFSANLDSTVLLQIPENIKYLNFDDPSIMLENQKKLENYFTLEIGQYPPTTIDILTPVQYYRGYNTSRRIKERIEYLGGFNAEVPLGSYGYLDVTPFAHTDLSKGYNIYCMDSEGNYLPLVNENNELLRAGNGMLSKDDLNKYQTLVLETYEEGFPSNLSEKTKTEKLLSLFDELPIPKIRTTIDIDNELVQVLKDYNGEKIYIEVSPGDYRTQTDVGDITQIIDYILDSVRAQFIERLGPYGTEIYNLYTGDVFDGLGNFLYNDIADDSISLPNLYHTETKSGWLIYYFLDENDEMQEVMYPCIEGKLYSDYYTGNLYYYTRGHMVPVQKNVLLPGTGLSKNNVLKYSIPEGNRGQGPYFETTIGLSDTTVSNLLSIYSSGSFGSINDAIAYIKEEYITLPFKWLLYNGSQFEILLYIPEPTLDIATVSENPNTTIGEFQKVSDNTTYGSPIKYSDISS